MRKFKIKKWQIVILVLVVLYIIGVTTEDEDTNAPIEEDKITENTNQNKETKEENNSDNKQEKDNTTTTTTTKKEEQPKNETENSNENTQTTKKENKSTDVESELIKTFSNLKLSDKQLKEIAKILKNVGATNFTLKEHNYTDATKDLCIFRGTFKKAKNLQVNITMENGKIFNVELAGLPKNDSYWNGNGEAVKLYYEGKYLNYYDQKNNAVINYDEKE